LGCPLQEQNKNRTRTEQEQHQTQQKGVRIIHREALIGVHAVFQFFRHLQLCFFQTKNKKQTKPVVHVNHTTWCALLRPERYPTRESVFSNY
jgi:hypothetical protein